ncbi:hypothetical protein NKI66_19510 [Mesorhizobium sp. M0518]|uniref:hypothetical protein n=1 Tax=Mesorhizobium sp. M0518 TaxID=2956956 RepID=UPI00333E1144
MTEDDWNRTKDYVADSLLAHPSDLLAQIPLKWLMAKAAAHGLSFRSAVDVDQTNVMPAVADSYGAFLYGLYRFTSKPYYRPLGSPPLVGRDATPSTINETIDASVVDRWRGESGYRPKNLQDWALRMGVDSGDFSRPVLTADPRTSFEAT